MARAICICSNKFLATRNALRSHFSWLWSSFFIEQYRTGSQGRMNPTVSERFCFDFIFSERSPKKSLLVFVLKSCAYRAGMVSSAHKAQDLSGIQWTSTCIREWCLTCVVPQILQLFLDILLSNGCLRLEWGYSTRAYSTHTRLALREGCSSCVTVLPISSAVHCLLGSGSRPPIFACCC